MTRLLPGRDRRETLFGDTWRGHRARVLHRDVAPGIHMVAEPYVNWFLVEDGGRLTVVDAGLPRSWNSLHDAVKELGRSTGDIDAIVLTHGHWDHVGFAERARTELGVPVHAPEKEVWLAAHPFRYEHERSVLLYARPGSLPVIASFLAKGAPLTKGVTQVEPFGESGSLGVPGTPTVVFTPGHTRGHCALHFPDRDAVIVGDAIVTLDPYTGRTGPRIVARAATADVARARRSLEAIAATGAGVVLTGHGEPFTQGARRAAELAGAAPVA